MSNIMLGPTRSPGTVGPMIDGYKTDHPCPKCGQDMYREPRTPPTFVCECGHRFQLRPLVFGRPDPDVEGDLEAFCAAVVEAIDRGDEDDPP